MKKFFQTLTLTFILPVITTYASNGTQAAGLIAKKDAQAYADTLKKINLVFKVRNADSVMEYLEPNTSSKSASDIGDLNTSVSSKKNVSLGFVNSEFQNYCVDGDFDDFMTVNQEKDASGINLVKVGFTCKDDSEYFSSRVFEFYFLKENDLDLAENITPSNLVNFVKLDVNTAESKSSKGSFLINQMARSTFVISASILVTSFIYSTEIAEKTFGKRPGNDRQKHANRSALIFVLTKDFFLYALNLEPQKAKWYAAGIAFLIGLLEEAKDNRSHPDAKDHRGDILANTMGIGTAMLIDNGVKKSHKAILVDIKF